MIKIVLHLNRCSKISVIFTCLVIIASLGFVRYSTGRELSLSIFYLFPIFFGTVSAGKRIGLLMSFLSIFSWLTADILLMDSFTDSFIPYVNEFFRLIVFILITLMIDELQNAYKKQKNLATIDSLTGILNRRAFYESAEIELNRSRRFGDVLSVAYIDLDNFKIVNDTYGHNTGDELLHLVVDTIKKNIRSIDIFARLGGDEFIILMSEVSISSAFSAVRKIQKRVMELMTDYGWEVTFSAGLVVFKSPPGSVDDIIGISDSVMYAAKQAGKNRIVQKVVD